MTEAEQERAEIVAWLRSQAGIGEEKGDEAAAQGKKNRARGYFGGMLALQRAADAIEALAHKDATPQ